MTTATCPRCRGQEANDAGRPCPMCGGDGVILAGHDAHGPRACRECGVRAVEVYLPDPREPGEQIGVCGLCESTMEDAS